MNRRALALPAIVAAACLSLAAQSVKVNPYEGQPRAAKAGQKLYQRECASCHGTDCLGSGHAPALVPGVRTKAPEAIFDVLRNGSLRRGMPSFAHLPEQQRWQIVTFLKGL